MHRQADLRREAADSSERLAEPLLARRLALLLEYQGTAYAGSQLQANAPTVQGALEQALRNLTGESIRVALAGRTDAGVHAKGQVAAFNTSSRLPLDTFARDTNSRSSTSRRTPSSPRWCAASSARSSRSARVSAHTLSSLLSSKIRSLARPASSLPQMASASCKSATRATPWPEGLFPPAPLPLDYTTGARKPAN